MKERERDIEPYWQIDQAIGEGTIAGREHIIRVKTHISKERYHEKREIVPLTHPNGQRVYFHARPYILQPEIKLTIGAYPEPQGDKIGEVVSSEWEGMKHQEIGNSQAWYYPAAGLAIIWECYLFDYFRQANPTEDGALANLWTGFESLVLSQSKGVKQIATPAWEPIYEEATLWQDFLRTQGYHPLNNQAFTKTLG